MATKLELQLLTDISDSLKAIKSFQKESVNSFKAIDSQVKKTSDSLTGFGASLKQFGAVLGGVLAADVIRSSFRAFTESLREGIDEAIEQEDAIASLNLALAQAGQFSEQASRGLQSFADQLQKTTKFSDDQILSAASLIESLGRLDSEGLKRATQAAADLSSALEIDLQTAAQLVGKAAAGEIGSFSRFGLAIRKGATDAETFANALDAIEGRFGGRAAAQINTFSGSLSLFNKGLVEIKEALGSALIQSPQFVAIIKELGVSFFSLSEAIAENSILISSFIKVLIQDSIEFFGAFSEGLADTISFLEKLKDSFLSGQNAFKIEKKEGALVSTLRSASSSMADLSSRIESTSKSISTGLTSALEKLNKSAKENLGNIPKDFSDAFKALQNELNKADRKTLDGLKEIRDRRLEVLKSEAKSNVDVKRQETELKLKIEQDYTLEVNKLREENLKKENERLKQIFQAPIAALFGPGVSTPQEGVAAIASAVNTVSQGAQGAIKLVGQAVGTVANTFLGMIPVVGELIGQIVEILLQTPEKFKQTINDFFDTLLSFSTNIAQNIGSLINKLIDHVIESVFQSIANTDFIVDFIVKFLDGIIEKVPVLIERFASEFFPALINSIINFVSAIFENLGSQDQEFGVTLINSIIDAIPLFIESFVNALAGADYSRLGQAILKSAVSPIIQSIENPIKIIMNLIQGAFGQFVRELLRGAFQFVDKILEGAGQFIEKIIQGIGDFFSGAAGGAGGVVSDVGGAVGGIIGDVGNFFGFADGGRVPDILSLSGDKGLTKVSAGEQILSKDLSAQLESFLNQESSQPVSINLQIGENQLANVLFNLNRQGFRTS